MLSAVLQLLAQRRHIPLDAMRTVLGQFVSIALLWRPALSRPHASYRFVQQPVLKAMVWPSVRLKLQQVRSVLPLLVYDIGAPACELVLSQDAAGPTEDGCPTGALCLGCGAPPLTQVQVVLARREVRGRTHLATHQAPPGRSRPGGQVVHIDTGRHRLGHGGSRVDPFGTDCAALLVVRFA